MPKLRHTENAKYKHLKINYETLTIMKKWRVWKKFGLKAKHAYYIRNKNVNCFCVY